MMDHWEDTVHDDDYVPDWRDRCLILLLLVAFVAVCWITASMTLA